MARLEPDTIGDWALHLRPDFAGRGAGGRYMVVYSYREPVTHNFYWAVGHSELSVDQARAVALDNLARQRLDHEIALLVSNPN